MAREGWRDRLAALLAARAPLPPGERRWPEGPGFGDPARGRRILAADRGAEAFWAGAAPEDHGLRFLDDLAALGDARARAVAWARVDLWLGRWGGGRGPGWTAAPAAARLGALVGQARFLLRRREQEGERLALAVARAARVVERRWRTLPPGPPRVLALAALARAGAALPGLGVAQRAAAWLGAEAERAVDARGGLPSRNPEELLDLLAALTDASRALAEAGEPPPALPVAGRVAPVLRALRHADGGLGRFHGGDRGAEGRLDAALAGAGRPGLAAARPARTGLGEGAGRHAPTHMGFVRMAAGRTTVIVDAAAPPAASAQAHASTLAFELTSGRRPLVVSCGPGRGLGPDWGRAARATASHSTLALEGRSSARLDAGGRLSDGPAKVIAEMTPLSDGLRHELAHDGWKGSHGLTHARTLQLSADGRALAGEDMLIALTGADRARLDGRIEAAEGLGVPFALRFHLHPDVEAAEAEEGVVLRLLSGEVWVLEAAADLSVEPSAFLEGGRARPALQVVARGRALGYDTRVAWRLAKAQGSPEGLRDIAPAGTPQEDP